MQIKKVKSGVFYVALILLFYLTPRFASAQMFSVHDTNRDVFIPTFAVYAGLEPIDFKYQGNNSPGPAANVYSFNGPVIRLMLESPSVNLYVGSGGNVTGLDEVSYFDAGIKAGFGLPLYYSQRVLIQLPLLLHSSYTRVTNEEVVAVNTPLFEQGTLEAGGGLELHAKFTRQFRVMANLVPSYGFSFSTRERNASGSIFAVEGKARLYFDHLFGSAGLSFGYNYNFRQYNIEGEVLDYNANANSFLIGITF